MGTASGSVNAVIRVGRRVLRGPRRELEEWSAESEATGFLHKYVIGRETEREGQTRGDPVP